MLPSPVAAYESVRRTPRSAGFTLIELLTVIAILAALSGIAFGVVRGVKQRAAIAQAKAELAALSQSLEEYKRQYGDYPQTAASPEKLFQALNGALGPTGATLTNGRRFITAANFRLNDTDPRKADDAANFLVDPWGNAYHYVYFHNTTSGRRGFVLYSLGPDGTEGSTPSTSDGSFDTTASLNADNIYANR